ncbi:hypothetical protein JW960_14660 [candidate division KSB1 bacterium]|nr:hypothetical protein [candidate division KSB1 bacterium]
MTGLAEILKPLLDKISDFFDILDLSFFISGAAVFAALVFHCVAHELPRHTLFNGGMGILIVIVMCYLFGLICFTIGRFIRNSWNKLIHKGTYDNVFLKAISIHQLQHTEPFESYLSIERNSTPDVERLYIRLWAELRQSETLRPSMSLLRRYWVMAATYDGLATAVLVWFSIFFIGWKTNNPGIIDLGTISFIIVSFVLLIIFSACIREANRYTKHQREEILATLATQKSGNASNHIN